MRVTLEICVDTVGDARLAAGAGADRLELCAALGVGGLTPTFGAMAEAAGLDVPVCALIRPRDGGFTYSEAEARQMLAEGV